MLSVAKRKKKFYNYFCYSYGSEFCLCHHFNGGKHINQQPHYACQFLAEQFL